MTLGVGECSNLKGELSEGNLIVLIKRVCRLIAAYAFFFSKIKFWFKLYNKMNNIKIYKISRNIKTLLQHPWSKKVKKKHQTQHKSVRHQRIMESCNGLATCTYKHISRNACGRNKFVTTTRAVPGRVGGDGCKLFCPRVSGKLSGGAWSIYTLQECVCHKHKYLWAICHNKNKTTQEDKQWTPFWRVVGHFVLCEGVCFIGILFFVCFHHVLPYAHEFVEHFF